MNGAGGNTEGEDPSWVDDAFAPYRAFHDTAFHTGCVRLAFFTLFDRSERARKRIAFDSDLFFFRSIAHVLFFFVRSI